MAGHTSNINLAKPTYSEDADIAVINDNMDIIDSKVGAVGNTSLQSQVTALNSNLSKLESADEPSSRFASIADLKSYISSIATGMKSNGALPITFTTDFTDDTFSTGARVYGTLMRRTDSYFSFIGTDILGNAISLSNNGGTWKFANLSKIVGTNGANARNLSGYTAKTLIDECVTQGYKLYYCSAAGGQKLSDLPITQAGVYIVRADTYYKSLDFMGTNGYDYHYDYTNNAWASLNAETAKCIRITLEANSTVYLNHTNSVIVISDRGGMWTEGAAARTLNEIQSSTSITVTRQANNKLKIASNSAYGTDITVFGYGEISFSNS